MRQSLSGIIHSVSKWYHSLKRWQRYLVTTLLVVVCIFWLLVISDISGWWHWSEWQEHIKSEHM